MLLLKWICHTPNGAVVCGQPLCSVRHGSCQKERHFATPLQPLPPKLSTPTVIPKWRVEETPVHRGRQRRGCRFECHRREVLQRRHRAATRGPLMSVCTYCGENAGWLQKSHPGCIKRTADTANSIKLKVFNGILEGKPYDSLLADVQQALTDNKVQLQHVQRTLLQGTRVQISCLTPFPALRTLGIARF